MMADLRDSLCMHLTGRVCLVGIGNPHRGDDGLGVRLAEAMRLLGFPDVIVAERTPERYVDRLARGGYEAVLFLDAVEMGASPGSVVFLTGREVDARYPQVSTHKIALGILARLIEAGGPARVFLLGVQPESVRAATGLSPAVETTLALLRDLLAEVLRVHTTAAAVCGVRP
jgi:hydrogenase maturation protease